LSQDSFAFTRRQRLLTPAQYTRVLKKGKRISGKYFRLAGIQRDEPDAGARLGLTIAKRSVKRAVDRNQVKRLARESFRHHCAELLALDVVVFANPSAATAEPEELRRHLDRQWLQLSRKFNA